MGRLFGIMSNRADRLHDELVAERDALAVPLEPPPSAWGLGFYQGGEVLHKKLPQRSSSASDWPAVAGAIRSTCVIGRVESGALGEHRSGDTHPFRFRHWLFAHLGEVPSFALMEARLLEALPDFLRRNVRGATDSELLFHVLLRFLGDENQLEQPDVDEARVLRAVGRAVRLVDDLSDEVRAPRATLAMLLSNGRHLFAVRRGPELAYVVRQGLPEAELAPARGRHDGSIRYACVVSPDGKVRPDYTPLADASVLVIDRDANASVSTL